MLLFCFLWFLLTYLDLYNLGIVVYFDRSAPSVHMSFTCHDVWTLAFCIVSRGDSLLTMLFVRDMPRATVMNDLIKYVYYPYNNSSLPLKICNSRLTDYFFIYSGDLCMKRKILG